MVMANNIYQIKNNFLYSMYGLILNTPQTNKQTNKQINKKAVNKIKQINNKYSSNKTKCKKKKELI